MNETYSTIGLLPALMALVRAGQFIAAVAMDHHGWLGRPARPVMALRVVGVIPLASGVVLITRF